MTVVVSHHYDCSMWYDCGSLWILYMFSHYYVIPCMPKDTQNKFVINYQGLAIKMVTLHDD